MKSDIQKIEEKADKGIRGKGILVQIQKIDARILALQIERDHYLRKLWE